MATNPIVWLIPNGDIRNTIRKELETTARRFDGMGFHYDALMYRHSIVRDEVIVATHESDTDGSMNYIYSKAAVRLPLVDLMSVQSVGSPVQYDPTRHVDYAFVFNKREMQRGSGSKILAYAFAKNAEEKSTTLVRIGTSTNEEECEFAKAELSKIHAQFSTKNYHYTVIALLGNMGVVTVDRGLDGMITIQAFKDTDLMTCLFRIVDFNLNKLSAVDCMMKWGKNFPSHVIGYAYERED